jgi:hypothetical protein
MLLTGCHPHSGAKSTAAAGPRAFQDVTTAAGLNYTWTIEGKRPLNILQTIGNGCAFLDYDNDGNLDILLVGPKLALYRGDGHGHFTDVTHDTGLDSLHGHFLGCAVGDYDNDGFDDIYISGYRTGLLLHNEQGRRFTDVTLQAGLQPQPWGTSCAFCETRPGTGRLDLFVANYASFDPKTDRLLCPEHSILTSCGPRTYKGLPGVLYLNDGAGHFHDASHESGMQAGHGRGLGVGFMDFLSDGRPALAVANDELPGDLFQTAAAAGHAAAHYTNLGQASGVAFDRDGNIHGGMGLDWGDFNNDGRVDLFVATFQNETKCLYRNEGDGSFRDVSLPVGLGEVCTPFVAFGCKFLDYDNDGLLDIAIANGHVEDNVHDIVPTEYYRQAAQLLHNQTPGMFADVSKTVGGSGFSKPIVGRGLATGDFDNDGKVDLLLVDSEGAPLLLHNAVETGGNHFIGFRLIGTKSNRDGYGAVVTVQLADGKKRMRVCHADGSYMSSSDSRVQVGLGEASGIASVSIRWPSGSTDTIPSPPVDRYLTIKEGSGIVSGSGQR